MLDALTSWQLHPWLMLALLTTALVYARGWRVVHAQMPSRFGAGRLSAFLAGLVAIFVAIASPLDAFAGLLLQVHMLQHLLLVMVAPPLLWIGAPAVPLLRGLPHDLAKSGLGPFLAWSGLQRALRAVSHPIMAGAIFAVAMLAWHLPAPYQLALDSPAWHQAEHLCFLIAGLLFWWPVVQPWPSQPAWPRWTMIPYLLFADLLNTILSAIFIFSERVIYPAYAAAPRLWGISPLEDQAIAGALMWVPGSIAFLVPAVLIVVEFASGRAATANEQSRRPSGPPPAGTPVLPAFRDALTQPRASFDLLRVPAIGPFLRWRYGRRVLQLGMLLLAVAVIADGLFGPQMAPMNLAGVLPWTHWRALVVVGLLVGGNVFCMACPFTLPRELAKRLLPAQRAWPRWLRGKWLAAGLLVLYLWAYETWALWDSPWWTAVIVLTYFAGAFAVDGLFRGASFCKYVCPIGQFHFVQSLVSPLTVQARSLDLCRRCTTHDCIRGNAQQRGCELDLFQPEKRGNLDCTFCLDCVAACPHDNVGILAAAPLHDIVTDPYRSSLRRLSERPDIAALALVIVFGAFANAAGMVAPVVDWQRRAAASLGLTSIAAIVTITVLCAVIVAPAVLGIAAAWLSQRLSRFGRGGTRARVDITAAPLRTVVCRFAFACIPLGLSMWTAHFLFHFLTGAGSVRPVVERIVTDFGAAVFAAPAWAASGPATSTDWITAIELALLDLGLLASLYIAWRIALHDSGRGTRAVAAWLPWALVIGGLWASGVWIIFQPMEMRGMIH